MLELRLSLECLEAINSWRLARMNGFYYVDGRDEIILVPYVFVAKVCDDGLKISFDPDSLERVVLAIQNGKERVKEKVLLGSNSWVSFDLGEKYIRDITNHCFKGRINDAFSLTKPIVESVIANYGAGVRRDGD